MSPNSISGLRWWPSWSSGSTRPVTRASREQPGRRCASRARWCGATRRGAGRAAVRRRRRRPRRTRPPTASTMYGTAPSKPSSKTCGIAREDRVVPVGTAAVVVRAQVQLAPHVLRYVVEERRTEISDDQDDEHRHDCGDEGRAQHDRVHADPCVQRRLTADWSRFLETLSRAPLLALAWIIAPVRIDGVRDAALSWHIPSPVPVIRGAALAHGRRTARAGRRAGGPRGPADQPPAGPARRAAARDPGLRRGARARPARRLSWPRPCSRSRPSIRAPSRRRARSASRSSPSRPPRWKGSPTRGTRPTRSPARRACWRPTPKPIAAAPRTPTRWPWPPTTPARARSASYGGVPPYPETRAYITDMRDRWSRIVGR